MTPQADETRELVRTRILAGKLPSVAEYRLFGGCGASAQCACCDRLISPPQVLFEVECALGGGLTVSLTMHGPCFDMWVIEARSYQFELSQATHEAWVIGAKALACSEAMKPKPVEDDFNALVAP